jgi:hypothetical protein
MERGSNGREVMTAMLLLELLFMPGCATLAGAILWLLHRNETLEDGALVRSFAFFLALTAGAAFGILRTDSVRMRIDPVFRMNAEIEADPLYTTIARISSDDASKLKESLQTEMAAGATLSDAMLTAHGHLWNEVRRRTGWVDQATKLEWARYNMDMLKHARDRRDHELCFAIMTNQALERATWVDELPIEDHQRFHDLAIRIYEMSDLGMRRELNSGDKHVEFNAAAREYSVISDEMEERFGREIVHLLRSDTIRSAPPSSFAQLCTARIYQLEAMQKRPKAMAAALVDSVVR